MIIFVAPAGGEFGVGDFLKSDGASVASQVRVMTYDEVFGGAHLPTAAYVFTGLDQLTPTELRLVARARYRIRALAPSLACFNDPDRWKDRLALLEAAYAAGENPFRATRATSLATSYRFPVFVRSGQEHTGSLSPLLSNRRSLLRELGRAVGRGYRLRDLLVVEYSDTSVDGVFTKYSAVILGDRIVPRARTTSRDWVTKYGDVDRDAHAADLDLQYVEQNPHERWLRRMFALAGVEYGRIDYAVRDGKPQVWEINTNPTIGANLAHEASSAQSAPTGLGQGDDQAFLRERGNRLFYERFLGAIGDLIVATDRLLVSGNLEGRTIDLGITPAERRGLERERRRRTRVLARRTLVGLVVAPVRAAYRRIVGSLRA